MRRSEPTVGGTAGVNTLHGRREVAGAKCGRFSTHECADNYGTRGHHHFSSVLSWASFQFGISKPMHPLLHTNLTPSSVIVTPLPDRHDERFMTYSGTPSALVPGNTR